VSFLCSRHNVVLIDTTIRAGRSEVRIPTGQQSFSSREGSVQLCGHRASFDVSNVFGFDLIWMYGDVTGAKSREHVTSRRARVVR
jgi:hypothetical protein